MMKRKKISLAKTTRPYYSGILPRKRLFTLLDQARTKPVIWITGPPGAGKTILVSSYIEAWKLSCLWYQVDAGDADAATFFYYMGLAANSLTSGRKNPLPLLTPEYIPGLTTFTRRYFEKLYGRLKTPSCVVFDNYHEAPVCQFFHDVIRDGLEVIPRGINVILISRSEPPQSLARLRVNHSMEVLGWDELRLTPEESLGLMRLKLKGKCSREIADDIDGKVKGWAAGLVLLLGKAKKGRLDNLEAIAQETIFDYFASEILQKLDPDYRDFLLKTSILPNMDTCMAQRLTGLKDAGRILADLYHNNCFIERRFHSNSVYQYHPLFRKFLSTKAEDSFPQEDRNRLQRKAAEILDESGKFEQAFVLYRDSSNWKGIMGLVMKHAQALLKQGRGRVLEEWITSLPEEVLQKSPWMLYYLGIGWLPFNTAQSRKRFECAFNLFYEKKDPVGASLACSGIIDSLTLGVEELVQLDRWIPIFDGLIRSSGECFSEEIMARITCSMYIGLSYRHRHCPEFTLWEERALQLAQITTDMSLKMQILSIYAFDKMRMGEFAEAALAIDSFHQLANAREATPLVNLFCKWMEAVYFVLTASHEDCLQAVNEGLKLGDSSGIHMIDFALLGHGALSALNGEDFKTAEGLLQKTASSLGSVRLYQKSFYHFLTTHYALLRGDIREAAMHSEIALKTVTEVGMPFIISLVHLLTAQVKNELGEQEKALYHLDQSRKIGRVEVYKNHGFACFLAEAKFAFDRGDDGAGLQSLRKALSSGRESRYFNTYAWNPKVMAQLCLKALEEGIEVEYVKDLIRKRNIIPEIPPVDVENWPWPVKIFTLGRFSILKDGSPVRFSRKAPQTPLALLKSLIALGGREVSEDQLTDILWPEADGDAAHQVFAINLHRLRSLLGSERALSLMNGRMTLEARYCHVDTWAFERILGKADADLKNGNKEAAVRLIERAVAMYQGPFLANDTEAPASILRERLRSKYLRYIGELGRLYEGRGDFQKAVNTFKKGIEAEPLAEEFYQYLITCYQKLGFQAEAMAAYTRLKNTLSVSLGLGPSTRTEAIYKRFTS